VGLLGSAGSASAEPASAEPASAELLMPPPNDVPEEVLRTQITLEGRSPVDNQSLSAQDYADEAAETAAAVDQPRRVSEGGERLVFLLRLRKTFRILLPFVPIP
jgi:hypothetical protein